MKKRLYKTLVALGFVFAFVISVLGNAVDVRAEETTKGMKIAKAIYE